MPKSRQEVEVIHASKEQAQKCKTVGKEIWMRKDLNRTDSCEKRHHSQGVDLVPEVTRGTTMKMIFFGNAT